MRKSSYRRTIEFGDCDPANIVWNPRYFGFAEHGMTVLFTEAFGKSLGAMLDAYKLAGLPVVQTDATFFRSVSHGDTVEIETSVVSLGRSSFRLLHRILLDGDICVEINAVRVWAGTDPARPSQMKGIPIPEDVRTALT